MSRGSACASRRDRAFVLPEEPQQRRLAEWRNRGTRRPTGWEDKRARRLAEFAARMPAIMAQIASGVSEAIAEALQATRAEHLKELDLVPTPTTTSVISESSTSIQMSGGSSSISTAGGGASASHDFVLPSAVPITCSTDCPQRDNGSTDATAAASASATGAVSTMCVLHEGGVHLAMSCFQPRDKLAWVLPSTATLAILSVPQFIALAEYVVAPAISSANIMVGPEAPTPATTKPAASAVLESDPIIALTANRVCLDNVPAMPTAVLMQDALLITYSSSSDVLVSMSASLDKLEGVDTAVTHEYEQQLTCLSVERSLTSVAAKDVANDDNLVTSTSVIPLTLAVLGVNYDSIANKHEAIASSVTSPIKLIQGDRNSGTYLHLKIKLPMLVHVPWDPGEQAKETMNPFCIRDSLLLVPWLRLPPDRVHFSRGCPCLHFVPGDSKSMWGGNLASIECLNKISELSCCCERWTYWRIHFFISGSRISSSIYALLICLKSRVGLEMRLELSMQTDILAFNCCSIVLHNIDCPWILGSSIQPGTPFILGTDSFWFQLSTEDYIEIHHELLVYSCSLALMIYFAAILIQSSRVIIRHLRHYFSQLQGSLIAITELQPCPVWEAYISGYKLQYSTQFGSIPWANQKKCIIRNAVGDVAVPCFPFGTIGNASAYGSHFSQWYMAWSLIIVLSFIRNIHLARSVVSLMITAVLASDCGLRLLNGGAATQCSDIFQWEIAWAFTLQCYDRSFRFRRPFSSAGVSELLDIIYVGIHTPQIPWDPSDCSPPAQRPGSPEGLKDACSNTPTPSQVPWDPGGLSQDRLGGKPNFMEGGLSASLYLTTGSDYLMDCLMGLERLAQPKWMQRETSSTNTRAKEQTTGLGTERWLRPGREDRLGVVLVIFFL